MFVVVTYSFSMCITDLVGLGYHSFCWATSARQTPVEVLALTAFFCWSAGQFLASLEH